MARSKRTSGNRPRSGKQSKSNPRAIASSILKLLQDNGNRSYHPKEIAKLLGYTSYDAYRAFQSALDELKRREAIKTEGKRIQYGASRREVAEGVLRTNREGYGYVDVEGYEDGFSVRPSDAGSASNGDRVRIRFGNARSGGGRRRAQIIEVIERAQSEIIGVLHRKGKLLVLEADDPSFAHKVVVADAGQDAASLHFKKALVALEGFDSFRHQFNGRIVEVFGIADDPEALTRALMRRHNLTERFPTETVEEAEAIPEAIPEATVRARTDLRARRIFTIDPDSARDFDDAIHIEPRDDGGLDLGVHIADVSHYVDAGTALDREAYLRATSVYLADRAIPMLPERLSGNLCSLRPNEDRLAFSCLITLGSDDTVTDFSFEETVIHSRRRFTYEEAQAVIDGTIADEPFEADIQRAAALTRRLRAQRHQEGSIDFDLPETRVRLDEAGNPIAVERKDRLQSHFLIEELMLLANRLAARQLATGNQAEGGKGIYRVHDRPDAERLQKLASYVRAFGFTLPIKEGHVKPQDLNRLMEDVRGTPSEPVIKYAALRTMAKAAYSTKNIGHYGLGFTHYSHFTSPIRRYPDLMAHRLLKGWPAGGPASEDLESRCEHCSERERLAEEAERDSVKQKQALYARQHVGDQFDGVVTTATKFGIFVEIPSLLLEGLIHVRNMDDDYYEYDEHRYALVGSHKGKTYQAGMDLRVRIEDANPHTGEIDFGFA